MRRRRRAGAASAAGKAGGGPGGGPRAGAGPDGGTQRLGADRTEGRPGAGRRGSWGAQVRPPGRPASSRLPLGLAWLCLCPAKLESRRWLGTETKTLTNL